MTKQKKASQKVGASRKRVFISHVSTESDLARALQECLLRDFSRHFDVFVSSDGTSIAAGKEWLTQVKQALEGADLQLVLCSTESVGRPWVNFEAGAAWLRGIGVVPVCHSGMTRQALPPPLNMLQGIELGRPEDVRSLYGTIASELGVGALVSSYEAITTELGEIEKKYVKAREIKVECIENPRILCAASEQYAQPEYQFDLDVAVLERHFPQRVTVESKLTRRRLLELMTMTGQHFDIVHLVVPVDRDTGHLIFSPVDTRTYKPSTTNPDTMSPERFADLIRESGTRLVVLATCRALLLAVKVARVANMAASEADITGKVAAEWEDYFYALLASGRPLHEAFQLVETHFEIPIRPIRHRDVAFAPPVLTSGPIRQATAAAGAEGPRAHPGG